MAVLLEPKKKEEISLQDLVEAMVMSISNLEIEVMSLRKRVKKLEKK